MKNILMTILVLTLFVSACNGKEAKSDVDKAQSTDSSVPEATDTLNIYNWSDYVDMDTVKAFEKQFHIHVRYDVYDSNETLEAKVLTGQSGYDIVVPGSSNIAREIKAGAYLPLDKTLIPNYAHLDEDILALMAVQDHGNQYVVPYFIGTNTIGINRTKVEELLGGALPENQWDLVFNPEYTHKLKSCGISYLDSPSEVFPMALQYLGLNTVSENLDDLYKAADLMKKVRPDIKRFSSSGYINDLARGELCVVIGYNSDINIAAKRAKEANSPHKIEALTLPGMIIWVDSLAIPKDAKNLLNAYRYINHTLDPQVAAKNASYVFCQSGSKLAKDFMDPLITQDNSVFLSKEAIDQGFIHQAFAPDGIKLSVRLWQNLKSGV